MPLVSLQTIKEMVDFETVYVVYKALNGFAPLYMQSMSYKLSDSFSQTLPNARLTSGFYCVRPQMGSGACTMEELLFGTR